jgi:putative tryptophan/tyrosine transport system ATP-binding protein
VAATGTEVVSGNRIIIMSENKTLLKLKAITKIFARGTVDEVTALDGVNLDVDSEDYIAVIGSNGAGKSTLLNVIAGVYPPESGEIILKGENITRMCEYRCANFAGRVYQDPHVGTAAKMTIEENMAMALLRGEPRGLRPASNRQRREMFRAALAPLGLGLENRLSALVGTLSGGQRQALALVMATISKPAILLLDEHIATLDPRTAQTVLNLTDMVVTREKMTTLMVTHNMELALKYGNRLIMMHQGKIVVDLDQSRKAGLTIGDLVAAFEQAAGRKLADDKVLLRD